MGGRSPLCPQAPQSGLVHRVGPGWLNPNAEDKKKSWWGGLERSSWSQAGLGAKGCCCVVEAGEGQRMALGWGPLCIRGKGTCPEHALCDLLWFTNHFYMGYALQSIQSL